MQDWWAPRTNGRPGVVIPVALTAVPALLRRAVDAVPGAAAMEIRADGAVLARRTSLAVRAENIVFAFHRIDTVSSRVEIVREGRDGLGAGRVLFVTPLATAVLRALHDVATSDPS